MNITKTINRFGEMTCRIRVPHGKSTASITVSRLMEADGETLKEATVNWFGGERPVSDDLTAFIEAMLKANAVADMMNCNLFKAD